jgi:molybdopterin synthase sulfur carrier subunit
MKTIRSFMIAVNGEYSDPEQVLSANDEIAVIPPVSGG